MLCSLRFPAGLKRPQTSSIPELLKNRKNQRKKMNRKYEGLIVLNAQGTETSIDDLVSSVSKELEEEGAKLDEIKQLGRKKFAYNARKLDGGHYVNYIFEAEGDVIEKIKARLTLNSSVHLQHYQRLA
jgi:small subunit ribosomal protein S6